MSAPIATIHYVTTAPTTRVSAEHSTQSTAKGFRILRIVGENVFEVTQYEGGGASCSRFDFVSGCLCQATLTIPRIWRVTEGLESRWGTFSNFVGVFRVGFQEHRNVPRTRNASTSSLAQHLRPFVFVERNGTLELRRLDARVDLRGVDPCAGTYRPRGAPTLTKRERIRCDNVARRSRSLFGRRARQRPGEMRLSD
jgi:hypothetical protein